MLQTGEPVFVPKIDPAEHRRQVSTARGADRNLSPRAARVHHASTDRNREGDATIPGYYAGGSNWAVRFSPTAVGMWTYTTQSTDAGLNGKIGSINCVANTNKSLHDSFGSIRPARLS